MKVKVVGLLICIIILLFTPHNITSYIVDNSEEIKISRIERGSILFNYGTFLTPGKYTSIFFKPRTYINPSYADSGPLDDGCFELFVEFKGDTTIVYPGTYCKYENLTSKFRLTQVPNAHGEKSWSTISSDKTGRYLQVDCRTGLENKEAK